MNDIPTINPIRDLLALPCQPPRHGADPCSLIPPADGWTTDLPGVVGWYWAGLADADSNEPAVPVQVRVEPDGPELRPYDADGLPVDWSDVDLWGPRIPDPPAGLEEAQRAVRVASWLGGDDGR